jgi:hypothetical protein
VNLLGIGMFVWTVANHQSLFILLDLYPQLRVDFWRENWCNNDFGGWNFRHL